MFNRKNKLVSIIIPCYNERDLIVNCLESLFAQDYEPKEIIVADGGSTDGTREILEIFEKEGKIRLIDNPKRFLPAGLNIGIKAAKGNIICRVDAHSFYEKDYVKKSVWYLEQTHYEFKGPHPDNIYIKEEYEGIMMYDRT